MLRLAIQRRLERGTDTLAAAALSLVWERHARLARPLESPVPVLCVGGATLGGSGKSPLATACARVLAERRRVVIVGHGYGARLGSPRRVRPDDDVALVGDEALEQARAGFQVVVGRDRQLAIHSAARDADVLVLDGPLQLAPRRATLSLLAVSERAPWGAGHCPPRGDLRAPRAALEAAADRTVVIGRDAVESSSGAYLEGRLIGWDDLAHARVGLATGIARPERVVALLARHEIVPRRVLRHADHAPFDLGRAPDIDVWLVTGKDAPRVRAERAATLAVLDYHLDLPTSLCELLTSRFSHV